MVSFSIITITYNAQKYIARTLESIAKQTSKDYEHIIIDGNSTDDTLKIVSRFKSMKSSVISEPDQGIYDAMNKGLKMAKGKYVWFINAGDELADSGTIEIIKERLSDQDLIYGDAYFVNEEGVIRGKRSEITPHKLKERLNWKDLKYGMLVCHQSLIVKKEIATPYILGNLSADLDWEIKAFKRAKSTLFINQAISRYLEGGVSNQQLKKSLIDRFKVLKDHFGLLASIMNHLVILVRGLKLIAKKGKYW